MLQLLITAGTLVLFGLLFAAICAVPAFILMLLLGALASVTGWACAIGFLPCFIITLIIAIFL